MGHGMSTLSSLPNAIDQVGLKAAIGGRAPNAVLIGHALDLQLGRVAKAAGEPVQGGGEAESGAVLAGGLV